ncbi:hypothetical protein SBOR_6488 [Sclerotinia borealis F-4128]|uniref:Uncharacterized protein n=1 Tax=Sclerotinia borealis (strain F-4128) TaxID=1432307 RepID=W9CB87_SCLBF|nr:hypothetical protein SBOR_6488 [Sclerotinia borealis F-4128]
MVSKKKRIPTPNFIESYQRKILLGITELNTKMQTLTLEERIDYLSNAHSSLIFRIDQVRVYIEQLGVSGRAQYLASMKVMEQDMLRNIILVRNLLDHFWLLRNALHSSMPLASADEIEALKEELRLD